MTTTSLERASMLETLREQFPGAAFVTVEQAADALQTSPEALRGRIKRGTVPAVRLGPRGWRIAIADLAAVLDHWTNETP